MCDTIAAVQAATGNALVLFGKNSDREFDEAQLLEWHPRSRHEKGARVRLTHIEIEQAPVTRAVLLSKPHWIWGAEIGANEHGLTIGNEALWSKIQPSLAAGVIGMDYLRLALERASGVDEGIHTITTLLRKHGQSGNCGFRHTQAYHNSFILADPLGAKVLETVDRDWVVRSITDYQAISNVMTIRTGFDVSSPSLETRAAAAALLTEGTFDFKQTFEDPARIASGTHRQARATSLMAARNGSIQLRDFLGVLRDHVEGTPVQNRSVGPRICAHTRENPLGSTTASWVASLEPDKAVHWVTGTAAPCSGLFKPMLLEVGLPDHGPRPGTDEDSASLWWSHERLRRRLDNGTQQARADFARQRDALESELIVRMQHCPPARDPESRELAQRIVADCWRDALEFEARWHP